MGDTVEGVETLTVRVVELCAMIERFLERARDHPLPEGMQERITGLVECVSVSRFLQPLISLDVVQDVEGYRRAREED